MTDGFKQIIGLLMFHNIPFEYGDCVYGRYVIGGHYDVDNPSAVKWEVDEYPAGQYGIAYQPTTLGRELTAKMSVMDTINSIMVIESMN